MNNDKAASEYLRTKVLTATPEELQLMLYDGAIRFAEAGRDAYAAGQIEAGHEALVRAQNIMLEMSSSLNHQVNPDLAGKLSSLYNFVYQKLVEGNIKHDGTAIGDALKVLHHQRETWVMLMDKLASERQADAVQQSSSADEESQKVGSLSLSV